MAAQRRGARGATLARIVALALALCALGRADALYGKKGDVEVLTEANFEGARYEQAAPAQAPCSEEGLAVARQR